MDDVAIVGALRAGEPAGVAELYSAYADRLFTYCVSMLRDRDAAADALHDTFVVAWQRAEQLRDPTRLRPWVYAIARNECLRVLRDRRRTAPLEEAGEVSDETADVDGGARDAELRSLVWAAADGLNPREREVLELSVRHGLDGTELAAAVGVSPNQAAAVLSTARKQLERALGALVVARTGRGDCPVLDGMLAGWDGSMSVLLRKRVARHIESCGVCTQRKQSDVSATALLGMAPLLVAPAALRSRLVADYGNPRLFEQQAGVADRAGRFQPDGFPIPLDRVRGFAGWQAPAVAGVAVLALLLGGFIMLGNQADQATLQTGPTPSPSAAPRPNLGPGTISPSPLGPATSARSTVQEETTATPPASSANETTAGTRTTDLPTTETPTTNQPSADPLAIYCDRTFADECSELTINDAPGQTPVFLASESPDAVSVRITIDQAGQAILRVDPSQTTVSSEQPTIVYLIVDREPCGPWDTLVDFGYGETLTVTGDGRACVNGSSLSPP